MSNERTLRHPNGGALKIGTEVHVSADSYCSYVSKVAGRSAVFESQLLDAYLTDSQSFRSTLEFVVGNGSVFSGSRLRGVYAGEAVLDRVIAEAPLGEQLVLVEVVAEQCELYGSWTLEGNARIHEGVWHRQPRFRRITGDNGVDFGLTECKPGYAMLGCWCKPLSELLRAGPRLGRKHGWSSEQIRAAKEFYEELADVKLEGVRT